ncbi:GNAT family N-acetyltransferase [Achromobacter sp. Marseille-Q0513]|uniref:GNAT family N-acetyltransferase n=1 Tax=Achromobacter sp. Marseille-Q0513 TaxID=2829161 RepID=UPI001B94C1DA|nr:GNAT family N-acetyltransferase [Achromobacter sp. Marseille-Q0513]MBR8657407.1 GNAT family N-acetyltransferase [Achromobacter sp. Marseille-Q0513]
MPSLSPVITRYWHTQVSTGQLLHQDADLSVRINSDLSEHNGVIVLRPVGGPALVELMPAMAEQAGLLAGLPLSEALLRHRLADAGIVLNGADHLYYFSEAARQALLRDAPDARVRQLGPQDADAFARFHAAASAQDLDNAWVELDHWAVYGAFVQGQLVCAASMYEWDDARITDTGVLTLDAFRGQGHARAVVRDICRHAYAQGYEPQYRCQFDNHASVALARAVGLTLYGTWEIVLPDDDE